MSPDDGVFGDEYRPRVRTDLEHAVIDGELVVFDPVMARVHQLDPLAALLWQFLDGTATMADLVADVVTTFQTSPEEARSGLTVLLEHLRDRFLLADQALPAAPATPAAGAYLVDPPSP